MAGFPVTENPVLRTYPSDSVIFVFAEGLSHDQTLEVEVYFYDGVYLYRFGVE
jgi:hypothetical protein